MPVLRPRAVDSLRQRGTVEPEAELGSRRSRPRRERSGGRDLWGTQRKNDGEGPWPESDPYIPKLIEQLEERRVDRREFLRTSTLLGLSATTAYGIVGRVFGESAIPKARAQGKPGGTLRVAMEVQKMDDPATYSWVQMSNQTRHIAEYLAITGPDNVTRPMLAESWEASDDLKTWTFHLRQGVMWHNGEDFVADHVVWNVERWRNADLGSSNIGLSTFASMDSVEAVDPHTVRFNLNKPVLSAPEDCYNYPTAILHPSFEAPFSDNPIGTGPYTLAEPLAVGDRCILRRITQTTDGKEFKYWGKEPFLDEIHYYHFDADNQLTAFASGDVDTIYAFGIEQFEFAEALPGAIVAAETAQTLCCRFKVTEPPFDNVKVRQALVKAADNTVYPDLVFQGKSRVGENHHVSPIHPEYFQLPLIERDVEGAKALLEEAGSRRRPRALDRRRQHRRPLASDGVRDLARPAAGDRRHPQHQRDAGVQVLGDLGQDAVRRDVLDPPPARHHGALARLPHAACRGTSRATAIPSSTPRSTRPRRRSTSRRAAPRWRQVEKILQDDAVMLQPVWRPVFTIITEQVKGYSGHPTQYHQFHDVWLEA